MKTLTVRLPEALVAQIEAESRRRKLSKSDVVRERLTGANRNTVMSLDVRVGAGCARLHDRTMRDLQVNTIELDEQWDFIAKKQRHVTTSDPETFGDEWLFKAVLSYVVGKRSTENTEALAMDLRARILNRAQITSDGYAPYIGAIENACGWNDHAMLAKVRQRFRLTRTRPIAIRQAMSLALIRP